MNYENVIRDFAQRTRRNLEIIEEIQDNRPEGEVFEVTQLINSMLGLLVFPQQQYINTIPELTVEELTRQGWPMPRTFGNYQPPSNLRELVRYLRNAIAHFNIEFLSNERGHIRGLRVWNINRGKRNWEAELSLTDLRKITNRFIDLLLTHTAHKRENVQGVLDLA